ncbi:MAG: iron chelate uptake ABC transporter family permease subunit [Candidatus Methanomethylophilaceae archaeon]|nr:iron chelate uptake ABC transporter family permease subunit [Candidatus Methanomethylophilaceae archaeon]
MDRRLTTVLLITALLMVSIPLLADQTDADESPYAGDFLLDYGTGYTEWLAPGSGSTYSEMIKDTLNNAGISYGDDLTVIAERENVIIGGSSTGGSLSEPGRTGVTVSSSWRPFLWDGSEWQPVSFSDTYTDGKVAVAFYSDGLVPVETPDARSSWTSVQGDSWNSQHQTAVVDTEQTGKVWEYIPTFGGGDPVAAFGGTLSARGQAMIKYGYAAKDGLSYFISYDQTNGDVKWQFKFKSNGMDVTSPAIMGQYVYIAGNNGYIYKFDWRTGPGDNNEYVTTFDGAPFGDESKSIPYDTIDIDYYVSYKCNVESLVADSGTIYCKAYNGMVYCFDKDLNLVWSYQSGGHNYYTTPTICYNYVFSGCYDGTLYVIDQITGELITKKVVYQTESRQGKCGTVNAPAVLEDGKGRYDVFLSYSDGLGMDSRFSGMAVFKFDGKELTLTKDLVNTYGSVSSYLLIWDVNTEDNCVLAPSAKGLIIVDSAGNATVLNEEFSGFDGMRNAPVLVNQKYLYITTYSSHRTVVLDIGGNMIGGIDGISTYAMVSPVVVDGLSLVCDDNGIQVFYSTYPEYVPPAPTPTDEGAWKIIMYVLIGLVVFLIALWVILKFVFKWEKPFSDMRGKIYHFFYGEEYTHNKRSRRKVRAVILFGVLITLAVSILSLCVGSETTMGIGEALSNAWSAISKGGHNLTYEEMLIYNQRLPRVLAAIAVGIGLSVAGAMYQAVIKNPLVEPYIMGVSSGAGTFAVAVLTFDFTFFGLFASNSIYLTAFSAIFGGLLAFGLTMLLALKTGGKSINYVLAGIVIGLVFTAVQSLLMIDAGTKVASALSWLYGSFSTMTWDKLWLVLIPSISLSFVPLIWAKEFNLVLLGEDQAKQMGLDAKRFDTFILIVASVLTSFCVAFCGIIGFVGLVIPHLSRMILGGDHRLMLPATMAFGGFLMVSADLLARVLLSGYELPVGAITTMIGVPVFAYLLIKRGRSYDV